MNYLTIVFSQGVPLRFSAAAVRYACHCATGWHVAHAATGSYFWRNKSNQNSHGGRPP